MNRKYKVHGTGVGNVGTTPAPLATYLTGDLKIAFAIFYGFYGLFLGIMLKKSSNFFISAIFSNSTHSPRFFSFFQTSSLFFSMFILEITSLPWSKSTSLLPFNVTLLKIEFPFNFSLRKLFLFFHFPSHPFFHRSLTGQHSKSQLT